MGCASRRRLQHSGGSCPGPGLAYTSLTMKVAPAPLIDAEGVRAILPHREPFLFVDGILELEPGRRVVGFKDVRPEEDYFRGHFPGNPVMPGVLILECLAQTGACALLSAPENRGKLALFGGLDDTRFRRPVRPGDRLLLEVTVDRVRGPVGRGTGVARVGDQVVAEATLTFALAGVPPEG